MGIGFAAWRRRGVGVNALPAAQEKAAPTAVGAWSGWREFRVARREFEDPQHTQCSFYLEPVDAVPLPPFKPGQFLTFSLPVADTGTGAPDGQRTITHCYSLSDQPQAAGYRITVKRAAPPPGRPDLPPGVSSSHFHDRVREGEVLKVKAPSGHFFIDPDPNVPVVLIGGCIGITSMMSMLRWCLVAQPGRTVHLYYGLRNQDEQGFKQQLEQLAQLHPRFHLNVVYSRPGANDRPGRDFQHAGHVDVDLLRRTLPHGRHQFYVWGPSAMMQSLVPALSQWGVAPEDTPATVAMSISRTRCGRST